MKPENILLTETGFPKIADFGLAKHMYSGVKDHTKAGTPAYCAPEILTGNYGFSVDVYSTGKILQDMMAKDYVVEWIYMKLPESDRPQFNKQWPAGKPKPSFTSDLTNLWKAMTHEKPTSRPTFFEICKTLEEMGQKQKFPHPFWGPEYIKNQIMPKGPPTYAYKPGKCPYAVGEKVSVEVDTLGWVDGVIDHIGEKLQPGAACVKFTHEGKEQVVLITPHYFTTRLRRPGSKSAPEAGTKQKCCCIIS
jgi:serine/threonine protein kinase